MSRAPGGQWNIENVFGLMVVLSLSRQINRKGTAFRLLYERGATEKYTNPSLRRQQTANDVEWRLGAGQLKARDTMHTDMQEPLLIG